MLNLIPILSILAVLVWGYIAVLALWTGWCEAREKKVPNMVDFNADRKTQI
jgi:hypothetical protein